MDLDRINHLLGQFPLTGEYASSLIDNVYKALLGRSLEVGIGVLEVMTQTARGAGETTAETARAIALPEGGTVRVFAPDTGLPRCRALALETPAGGFIAALNYSGPADSPESRLRGINIGQYWQPMPATASLPTDRDGCARWVAERDRHAAKYRPVLADAIKALAKGGFCMNQLFETTVSRDLRGYRLSQEDLEPGEFGEWREAHRTVRDIRYWPDVFMALKEAIRAHGLVDRFRADAQEFAGRRFDLMLSLPEAEAATALGDLLARADGYLPGANAAAGLRRMYGRVAETGLARALKDLPAIHALCRDNEHTSAETAFEYKDADNFLHAPPSGNPDVDLIAVRSQNFCHVVALVRTPGERATDGPAAGAAFDAVEVHRFGRPLEAWFRYAEGQPITGRLLEQLDSTDRYANPHATPRLHDVATVVAAAAKAAERVAADRSADGHGEVPPSLVARFAVTPGGATTAWGPRTDPESVHGFTTLLYDLKGGFCALDGTYKPPAAGPRR